VLAQALAAAGIGGKYEPPAQAPLAPALRVASGDPAHVGHIAFTAGVEIHELRLDRFDLEQLFFALTEGAFAAPAIGAVGAVGAPAPPPPPAPFTPPPTGGRS
jgi:ABC-2 type transport system ATP-binding protein